MKKIRMKLLLTACVCVGFSSAGYAAEYTYDDLNRLTLVEYEDGSSIEYSYDAAGNITEITRTGSDEPEEPVEPEEPEEQPDAPVTQDDDDDDNELNPGDYGYTGDEGYIYNLRNEEDEKPAEEPEKEDEAVEEEAEAAEPEVAIEVNLSDIDGHWAAKNIIELVEMGAVSGYPDGTFKPDSTITRAEFAAMLVNALELQETSNNHFNDITKHWAKAVINTAFEHDIVKGFEDGAFKPNERITREQMAAMIVNALKLESENGNISFDDIDDISPWAIDAMAVAIEHGILSGYDDNTVRPKANATRAEAVTVIVRSLKQ